MRNGLLRKAVYRCTGMDTAAHLEANLSQASLPNPLDESEPFRGFKLQAADVYPCAVVDTSEQGCILFLHRPGSRAACGRGLPWRSVYVLRLNSTRRWPLT